MPLQRPHHGRGVLAAIVSTVNQQQQKVAGLEPWLPGANGPFQGAGAV
jgi:hypothetical protein